MPGRALGGGNLPRTRVLLRDLLGPITLNPKEEGSLWANCRLDPAALVRPAGVLTDT